MRSPSRWVAVLVALGFVSGALLVACGGSSSEKTATQAPAATATRPAATSAPPTSAPATTAPAASPTSAPPTTAPAPPTAAPAASPTTQAASGGGAASLSITIADFNFTPGAITARAGQAITLNVTNAGQFPHTFTIAGVADSGTLAAGARKPVTFTPASAGTLIFFCMIHGQATMSGTITVSATGSLAPAPGGATTSGNTQPAPTVAGYDYGY